MMTSSYFLKNQFLYFPFQSWFNAVYFLFLFTMRLKSATQYKDLFPHSSVSGQYLMLAQGDFGI